MTLRLNSPVFTQNAKIPNQFSRDGGNVSPPIEWQGAPAGTRSYALVVEDPDAPKGTFRHWAAYDIPPDAGEEVLAAVQSFARSERVSGACLVALGAFQSATVGWFDFETREHRHPVLWSVHVAPKENT